MALQLLDRKKIEVPEAILKAKESSFDAKTKNKTMGAAFVKVCSVDTPQTTPSQLPNSIFQTVPY